MTVESSKELQTGEGELSTGLIFKCGDVEEKPH
jgi:hypothetical protein